jgi:hypothetical protein
MNPDIERFIYKPKQHSNRRATGAFWRGHKMFADIYIRPLTQIWYAKNHVATTYFATDKPEHASRICRASGEFMDGRWFFIRHGEVYYVSDTDIIAVEKTQVKKCRI